MHCWLGMVREFDGFSSSAQLRLSAKRAVGIPGSRLRSAFQVFALQQAIPCFEPDPAQHGTAPGMGVAPGFHGRHALQMLVVLSAVRIALPYLRQRPFLKQPPYEHPPRCASLALGSAGRTLVGGPA